MWFKFEQNLNDSPQVFIDIRQILIDKRCENRIEFVSCRTKQLTDN